MPNRRNILLLADIFGNRSDAARHLWMNRFTRFEAAAEGVEDAAGDTAAAPERNADTEEVMSMVLHDSRQAQFRLALLSAVSAAAAGVLGFLFLRSSVPGFQLSPAYTVTASSPSGVITDVRFCTDAGFDDTVDRCRVSRKRFPEGTKLIHVSFEADGVPEGQPFERRWYRDGQMFLQRDGFFDEVWTNWTWLRNPEGHPPGQYHLRLVVDGDVTTAGFVVE